mmetsp:Transcript_107185/g.311334  ORF Transcript_107185/g.311334 Transcript_107185/m.311334 type:complete len:213 (+) Transcript_107185:1195-1833(+)
MAVGQRTARTFLDLNAVEPVVAECCALERAAAEDDDTAPGAAAHAARVHEQVAALVHLHARRVASAHTLDPDLPRVQVAARVDAHGRAPQRVARVAPHCDAAETDATAVGSADDRVVLLKVLALDGSQRAAVGAGLSKKLEPLVDHEGLRYHMHARCDQHVRPRRCRAGGILYRCVLLRGHLHRVLPRPQLPHPKADGGCPQLLRVSRGARG